MLMPLSWRGGVTNLFFFLAAGALSIGSLPLCRTRQLGLGAASPSDELLGILLLITAEISTSVL